MVVLGRRSFPFGKANFSWAILSLKGEYLFKKSTNKTVFPEPFEARKKPWLVGLYSGLYCPLNNGDYNKPLERSLLNNLGGGFKYFLFSTLFGEMIQFD